MKLALWMVAVGLLLIAMSCLKAQSTNAGLPLVAGTVDVTPPAAENSQFRALDTPKPADRTSPDLTASARNGFVCTPTVTPRIRFETKREWV